MPHFLKNPMWKPGKSQNFNFSMFLPSNYQAVSIPMTMLLRTLFRSFRSQPIPIISEAVFSSSNPLVGRLRILGFVVETDGCGARLGRRRTRLFLACFLSHFRKRQSVTLSTQGPSWTRPKAYLRWKEDTLRPTFFGGGPSNSDSSILKPHIVLPGIAVPQ